MDVLKKINKLRIDRKWSVYRLSVESGISQSTLTNMFNRETLPSITTLECICHAFGITMSEFFDDCGEVEVAVDGGRREFTALYESLPPQTRRAILNLMRELSAPRE